MWVFCSTGSADNPVVNLSHIIAIEKFEDGASFSIGFHKPMGYIEWNYNTNDIRNSEYDRLMKIINMEK